MSDPGSFVYDLNAVSQELHVRPEILSRLLKSFSGTLAQKIAQLDEALPKNDIVLVRAIMHEVKGTSGNLRLNDVYRSADAMHVAVKASDPMEKVGPLFDTFRAESYKFIDHFKNV
ncbi:MAG TPA: Hpt domain-containing protein [Candidatus Omnitrophota bacterium]|nr:Hpt domain-containing protein [Candidatus Omnitrophota bacterium]HQL41326.1 Hpt domain-containing protein [Candidatus Omnitrophota bacterium]